MDSVQWLEFTVFTGLDKYKARISKLLKDSKKVKNSFEYMKIISLVYLAMEELILDLEAFV